MDPKTSKQLNFTLDEVIVIIKNLGHDTECGTCMEVAFTGGSSGHPHTCGRAYQPQVD